MEVPQINNTGLVTAGGKCIFLKYSRQFYSLGGKKMDLLKKIRTT